MAKSVLELAVGTGQWDAGLKKAKSALDNFTQANGGLQSALNKDSKSMQTFVQMMGRMDSTAKTAKGQMNDYKGTIEQLTMQYNRLTDAQKQTIGQDYLHSIDQMKQKYQAVADEVAKINQSLKQTNELSAGTGSGGGGLFGGGKLDGMLQVFGGNVMTKIAGAGLSFAGELKDMVTQGIELARQGEGIRIAFERLGRGDILQGLREATHGTVTDLELMKAAVKFNDFKLPLDELGTMLAFAQQKAKDTGQSVDYMVDSIVTGLGRKSLMILDNLGLSAAEVKEKMAETGDMTKAVGAIIREQMSKAGDYVETAADRATQANVSLQNKMEELGRKFAPIEEASNSLWTSMKIKILDVVGGPLAKMLNSLTESGRLMNALSGNNGEQGSGNTKVDQQLNKLRGSNYKQFYYNKVVENYTKQINDLQAQINNGGKKPGAGSGTSQDVRYLTAQKQSLEVMRELFRSGAKDIMQPVKVDIKTDEAEQNITSLTKKLKELQEQRKKAIAAGDKQKSSDLLKQINQTKADIKGLGGKTTTTDKPKTELEKNQAKIKELTEEYIKLGDKETEASQKRQAEIKKEIELLQQRNNLIGLRAEQVQGKLLGGNVQMPDFKNRSYIIDRSHLFDTEGGLNWQVLQKYNDQTSVGEYKWRKKERDKDGKKEEKKDDKMMDNVTKLTSGVSGIFSGIEQMGIEIPDGMKQALNAINGLTSIATSILVVIEAIKGLEAIGLFKLAGGGVVHAAGGYTVPGNLYSGDQVPAMLNSGELVLNRAQQSTLASQLQGQDKQMHVVGEVQGEKIILVANRTFRRKGQGEIVTW